MKKTVLTAITIIILSIVFVLGYGMQAGIISMPKIFYFGKVDVDKLSIRYYYSWISHTDNNEVEGEHIDVSIKDEELIKLIKQNLQNKFFINFGDVIVYDDDHEIYKLTLSDKCSINFEPSSKGSIFANRKGRRLRAKIDKELITRLQEVANKAYIDSVEMFKTDRIELYINKGKFGYMTEISDTEKINKILDLMKTVNMEALGDFTYRSDIIEDKCNLQEPYYEVFFNDETSLYVDGSFENIYGIKLPITKRFFQEDRCVLKLSNTDKLADYMKELVPQEDASILDAGFEKETMIIENNDAIIPDFQVNLSVLIQQNSLSNEGINLILKLDGSSNFSRVRDNDFIIYKEANGNWEELEAYVEPDKNTINKSASKITEKINWNQKYGTLEPGIYKLERNVIVSDVETSYYVIFEIK